MGILRRMLNSLEGVNHLPIPAVGFGVITLAIAIVLLAVVLGIGASRPHS